MTKPVIVTRAGKGSALTWTEGDSNVTNLQNATVTLKAGTGGTDVVSDLNGTVTLVAGTNVTLSGDNTAKTVTINSTASGGASTLNDLTDVTISGSPSTGQVIKWSTATSQWTNQADAGIDGVYADPNPSLGGNLTVMGYSIVSSAGGDIAITPNSTGNIVLDGQKWPQADGTANQILKTDGAGQLSWTTGGGGGISNVVEDTTPQLGGNLDVNGQSIVSTSNANIVIEPNGTGDVHIITDALRVGDLNTEARISTYGTGNLVLTTNEGNDPDPSITINNGANANITLTPSGTGKVIISGDLQIDGTTTTVNSTTLDVDDINITLAKGAANAAAANGGGITLEGPTTAATITYTSADDRWNMNKTLAATLVGNVTGNLTGNADTATGATNINISTTDGNTSDTTLYPVLVGAATTGNQLPHIDSGVLSFNASTNILSSTGFAGALNGTVGATTANTGAFTTLTATGAVTLSPASLAVAISPTGTGTVAISPAGALTINPTTASTINNTSIGATTASTGRFTTVTSTIATGTAPFTVASTTNVANLNASTLNGATFAAPGAIGGTTAGAGAFTTLSASSTVSGTGFSTYLASPPAIGGTAAAAGTFTALTSTGLTTLKTYKETISAGGSQASAYTPDYSLGTVHTVTLTGNVTFAAPTNMAAGNSLTLILTQDATGGRTGSWNASYKWLGGTPTLSTTGASIDVVNIFYDGTNYITGISKQDTSTSVTGLTVTAAGEIRLADTDSSNYVGFKAPATVSANNIWTLPATDGTNGQVLSTNGSDVLSWITPTSGGNNIILITTSGETLAMPAADNTATTSTFVVRGDGGVSGVSATTGYFTLPAGTYLVNIPFTMSSNATKADVKLYNVSDGTQIAYWAYQSNSATIGSAADRAQFGSPTFIFTLAASKNISIRNAQAAAGTWALTQYGGGGDGKFAIIIHKTA